MEALHILYIFSILVLCVSIFFRFFSQSYSFKSTSKLPPGKTGWPIFGETFEFVSLGPEKFIRQRMEKYSQEVFTTSMFGEKVAVVCGAIGNKFLFYTGNDSLHPWIPSSIAKLLSWIDSGRNYSIIELFTKYRKIVLREILNAEAWKTYIPVMDSMVAEHVNKDWVVSFEETKVFPLVRKAIFSLGCKFLLGVEDPGQVQKFYDSCNQVLAGMLSMPINLPGTTYNRAVREVKKIKREILKIIQERKSTFLENSQSSDILSRMLRDQNISLMSDLEIAFILAGLLLPSYETTSATITFALKFLAQLPHIYDAVYTEDTKIAESKAPHELLNWEDIQKMKYSWNVICEAMRLVPPSPGTFREAKIDINFAGFTIPKGWKIFWSPFTTNKNPKYFPDSESFDPSRYEGDTKTPCTFVPFGGGPRMCAGKEYAEVVILVYMYNVVKKFKLQNLIQDEETLHQGSPVPANGLPMRLKLHAK